MKVRIGFVSNSSSSSFICPVCNEQYAGRDGEYEIETCFCEECDNEFCRDCVGAKQTIIKYGDASCKECMMDANAQVCPCETILNRKIIKGEECPDKITPEEWGLDVEFDCPVCNIKKVQDEDILKYVLKINNLKKKDIVKQIQGQFKSYKEFEKYLKAKK